MGVGYGEVVVGRDKREEGSGDRVGAWRGGWREGWRGRMGGGRVGGLHTIFITLQYIYIQLICSIYILLFITSI